jgi:SAM-dependent methyltransferase
MNGQINDFPIGLHNTEIQQNLSNWTKKPILHRVYKEFYRIINDQVDYSLAGEIVELGSGIGNIRMEIPQAICTDLFKNPWIDQVENAYALSFKDNTISNLILFDVFHHLQYPGTAFREFHRVLKPGGKIIIFDPSISLTGFLVYGLIHHEPVAWFKKIEWDAHHDFDPWSSTYYAAQGNAERVFFAKKYLKKLSGWRLSNGKKFAALTYLLSGGYSKPQLFPSSHYDTVKRIEKVLDHFPKLFATRLLVVLTREPS